VKGLRELLSWLSPWPCGESRYEILSRISELEPIREAELHLELPTRCRGDFDAVSRLRAAGMVGSFEVDCHRILFLTAAGRAELERYVVTLDGTCLQV
jgi:hypothetical protein